MAKSSSKPKTKRTIKTELEEEFVERKPDVLDEDGVFKLFFTQNVQEIIAFILPDLHAAVDWLVPIEFCEQELINFLRGRFRQVDKRKIADKLLKLRLLSGKDHFVFFHNEFQNDLPEELPLRWFKSRMLISLRYNVETITTLIIFTGKAPLKKHSVYDFNCFGTRTTFSPNIFVVINQSEKQLIAASNPIALAFLAAKYAAQTKGDPQKRYKLKKKVLNLAQKKGFDEEHLEKIVSFVFDYMVLPKDVEEKLILETPVLQPLKSENMYISENRKMVRDAICFNATGMTFDEYRFDTEKKAEAKNLEVAAAKAEAEAAAKAAAKAAAEAAAEAAAKAKMETNIVAIRNMRKLDFSAETIAGILNLSVENVVELAKRTL